MWSRSVEVGNDYTRRDAPTDVGVDVSRAVDDRPNAKLSTLVKQFYLCTLPSFTTKIVYDTQGIVTALVARSRRQ